MTSDVIHIGSKNFHYLQAGSGRRLLICFHGYRNDATMFRQFIPYLEHEFTMLSIDLPHQGKTIWDGDWIFSKEDLKILIPHLLEKFNAEKFSLLGYSIGGRVCLCAVELFPECIEQCVLAASDGLVFNRFYHFVTKNQPGSNLFKRFLSDEKNLGFIEIARRCKLITEKKYRFVMHYLKTDDDRIKLRQIWDSLALLIPDHPNLKKNISHYAIPVFIFMGRKDQVIPLRNAQKFVKGMHTAKLTILEKGHRVIDDETIPVIAQTLTGR